MNFSVALHRIRNALAISQGQLSELTKLSVSMISAIENGIRAPSDESVAHLLFALLLSREELEIIAIESDDIFKEKYCERSVVTQSGILETIAAQLYARKQLKISA